MFGGLGVHVEQTTRILSEAVSYDLIVPGRTGYHDVQPGMRLHQTPAHQARTDLESWLRFSQSVPELATRAIGIADLIHCHDWMTVLAGIALRQMWGRPLVFNVHLPQPARPNLYLENLGLAVADLVIVNSEAVRREVLARRIPIRRVEVVPNGVDLARFTPAADWPADDGSILFVGRLVAQKGVDVLLRAFSVLLRRCPQSRLVVIGDGDLELYLKRVARHLGLPNRVSFVPWRTGEALVERYQRAQMVVMPSYYEPFGIVALEVMACGRPVVASRVGGLTEIIEHGVQGYLAPVGDHLELARYMAGLVGDVALRQTMGQAARERASAFTWERTARETLALYDELAGETCDCRVTEEVQMLAHELLSGIIPPLAAIAADSVGSLVSPDLVGIG